MNTSNAYPLRINYTGNNESNLFIYCIYLFVVCSRQPPHSVSKPTILFLFLFIIILERNSTTRVCGSIAEIHRNIEKKIK